MSPPSTPSTSPLTRPWTAGANAIGVGFNRFSAFLRESSKVLGFPVPLSVECAETPSSRNRLKRRNPSFELDSSDHLHPRKRQSSQSRVPIYKRPIFDKDTEEAIHDATIEHCAKRLNVVPKRTTRRKQDQSDKLILKLRLPAQSKKQKSRESRRSRDEQTQRTPQGTQDDSDVLYIPKRNRSSSRTANISSAASVKPRKPADQHPATKILHPRPAGSVVASNDVIDVDNPPSPKTPLDNILQFARGNDTTLAKIGKGEKKEALKRRTSLGTFPGCADLSNVSLTAYLHTLASIHHEHIVSAVRSGKDGPLVQNGLDNLERSMTDVEFGSAMLKDSRANRRGEQRSVPYISKTIDVVQLIFRLWQKMSCAEESLAEAFTLRLYRQGVVQSASFLAFDILSMWHTNAAAAEVGTLKRSDLVEFCVRILSMVLVYELSPCSDIWGEDNSNFVFKAKTEKGEPWLPKILDIVLFLVDHDDMATSRDCRVAAGELFQLYVVRCHCPFPKGSKQKEIWDDSKDVKAEQLNALITNDTFWSNAVGLAMQIIRKQEDTPDADFAIAFLHSLLSEAAAAKSLVQKQTVHRDVLMGVLTKLFERLERQMMSTFVQIERRNRTAPGMPSSVDLIRKLMSSVVLQRELVSSRERERSNTYLSSIASIFSRLAKLVPGEVESDQLMRYVHEGVFSGISEELLSELPKDVKISQIMPEVSDGEADDPNTLKDCSIAMLKALAFGAWLLGSLGKSMEDGSRDMTKMNGLQVLFSSSHFNSSRRLKKLWANLFKIQAGLERFLPESLVGSPEKPFKLLSEDERGHFCMAVEAVRLKVISAPKERSSRMTPDSTPKQTPKQSSSEGETENETKHRNESFSFPDVTRIKGLRQAVASDIGFAHFEDDVDILSLLERTYRSRGEQTLARYDSSSEYVSQYIRLPKKNQYIESARDLLDKAEKTVGQKCSCIPGNPVRGRTDSQMRIACSNNLCENRSTHVECAPDKCGAGAYCQNQRMQKMQYGKMKKVHFPGKGMGIVADDDIPAGSFIGEYQGEVISMEMFEERKREYHGERHFYFMTLTSKLVIDASRKSQITRFMNHSCEPNAETQKWNAGGEPRVGIFALRDISKSEEITFDYGARSLANDTAPCLCGASSCRGFLTKRKKPEDAKDDDEEAIFDTTGFVNATDDMKTLGVTKKLKDEHTSSASSDKLQNSVQVKIERGKKDIAMAEEVAKLYLQMKEALKPFEESSLTPPLKKKMDDWVQQVRDSGKKRRDRASSSGSATAKSETRIRIPRRTEPPRQESFLVSFLRREGEAKNSSKAGAAKGREASRPFPRKPPIQKSSSSRKYHSPSRQDSTGRPSRRSYEPNRDHRPVPPNERKERDHMVGDLHSYRSTKPTPPTEYKAFDRPGPMPAFLPTAPKVKKPLPRPKVAKKEKPKRDDSDVDSMDDYSIASSAEPVIEDDPPLSPSNLPDGLGACSDDEFVEAPPLEGPPQRHPENERIDPRSRGFGGEQDRHHARDFSQGAERHRSNDSSGDVRGLRHGHQADHLRRWPEEHHVRSSHNPAERHLPNDRSAVASRLEPRRHEDYHHRRSGPELERTSHHASALLVRNQSQVRGTGPLQGTHILPEARSSREERDDRFPPEGRRPPHEAASRRHTDRGWIDSAPRGYDRGRSLPVQERENSARYEDDNLRGRHRPSDFRDFQQLEHGDRRRREMAPPHENHPSSSVHEMPPSRRDSWGQPGTRGPPQRPRELQPAEQSVKDDDYRSGRGLRQRHGGHANPVLLREMARRGERRVPTQDQDLGSRQGDPRGAGTAAEALPSHRSSWGANENPHRHSSSEKGREDDGRHTGPTPNQISRSERRFDDRRQFSPHHGRQEMSRRGGAMDLSQGHSPRREARDSLSRSDTNGHSVLHRKTEGLPMRERGHPDAEQDIAKAKQKADGFEPKDAIKPSDRKSSDSSLAKKEENTRFVDRTKELQRGGKIEVPGSDGIECAVKDEALQKHLDKQPKRAEMEKVTGARSMPERYDDRKMKASTAQRKVEERPRQMSRDQTLEQSGFKKCEVPNEEDRSALVGKDSGAISKPLGRFQNKQRENKSSKVSVGLKRDEDGVSGKGSTNESVRGRCSDMQSNRGSKNSGEQGEKVGQEVQATDKAEQRKNAKRFAPRRHEDVVAISSEEKTKGAVGRRNLGSQVFIANTAENGEEKITGRSSKLGGEREASKLTGRVVHGESVARVERGSRDLRAERTGQHDEMRSGRGLSRRIDEEQRRGMESWSGGRKREREGRGVGEEKKLEQHRSMMKGIRMGPSIRRDGEASMGRDGMSEKDKSVMKRIGRRPGEAAEVVGDMRRDHREMEGMRSRDRGSYGGRHGDVGHERRRRSEGLHEHGRKRFRRDETSSPRREGMHGGGGGGGGGGMGPRRHSMDMAGGRQMGMGMKRGHGSEWREMDQRQMRRGAVREQGPSFSKEADLRVGPKPKKPDLRRLIQKKK